MYVYIYIYIYIYVYVCIHIYSVSPAAGRRGTLSLCLFVAVVSSYLSLCRYVCHCVYIYIYIHIYIYTYTHNMALYYSITYLGVYFVRRRGTRSAGAPPAAWLRPPPEPAKSDYYQYHCYYYYYYEHDYHYSITCICVCIYIHIYIYIYVHMCIRQVAPADWFPTSPSSAGRRTAARLDVCVIVLVIVY